MKDAYGKFILFTWKELCNELKLHTSDIPSSEYISKEQDEVYTEFLRKRTYDKRFNNQYYFEELFRIDDLKVLIKYGYDINQGYYISIVTETLYGVGDFNIIHNKNKISRDLLVDEIMKLTPNKVEKLFNF